MKAGDRVTGIVDGAEYDGKIQKTFRNGSARILFDDGDVLTLTKNNILSNDIRPSKPVSAAPGFNQYGIEWQDVDRRRLDLADASSGDCPEACKYFAVQYECEQGSFVIRGELARTTSQSKTIGYVLWMNATENRTGKRLAVPTIWLGIDDPRDDINELNSEICAAINKWMYDMSEHESLKDLVRKSTVPAIFFTDVRLLDAAIMELQAMRDAALRLGGQRCISIKGNQTPPGMKGDPVEIVIHCDLTTAAMAIGKGHVPAIAGTASNAIGAAVKKKGRGVTTEDAMPTKALNDSTIQQYKERIAQLNNDRREAMKKGDDASAKQYKSEASKLRKLLRNNGIKGGAR